MICMKKNQIMLHFLILKLIYYGPQRFCWDFQSRPKEGNYSLNVENGIIDVVHIMLILCNIIFTNSDYHEETYFRKAYFGYKEVRM